MPKLFTIYTTSWCGDCVRTKSWLKANGYQADVEFEEVNIEHNPEAAHTVRQLNGGNQSVPTLVFADGTVLTEPSNQTLAEALADTPPQS